MPTERLVDIAETSQLEVAYRGSYYFIAGAGGEASEWMDGYDKLLVDEGIGKPTGWLRTTGAAVNGYAGQTGNPYPLDLTCLMFPLDGLDMGRLAIFKLKMEDRWFDDVIDNLRRQ